MIERFHDVRESFSAPRPDLLIARADQPSTAIKAKGPNTTEFTEQVRTYQPATELETVLLADQAVDTWDILAAVKQNLTDAGVTSVENPRGERLIPRILGVNNELSQAASGQSIMPWISFEAG